MTSLKIDKYMTLAPLSIGSEQSLAKAHQLMREHHIRHLPVLKGGKLLGVVTERDLHLVETLRDVDAEEVLVEEAMTSEVFTVKKGTLLVDAARAMIEHKYGSAVVMDGNHVCGIFTTIDALKALVECQLNK